MPWCDLQGVRLYYEEAGQGKPVVFAHGHTITAQVWDSQWPVVSARYRAIRYDLRGHGRSSAPATGYTPAHHADDLHALLQYLHAEGAALVGLSVAGSIILETALSHPGDAAALVFVDATLNGYPYSPEFRQVFRDLGAHIREAGVQTALERVWLGHALLDGVRRFPERYRALHSMALQFSGAEYRDSTRYPPPPRRHIDRLTEVTLPTLVVVGELDLPDFQGTSEGLYRGIPGARKVVIADAGHIPNFEQPDAFNAVLLDFLDTVF